MSGAAVELNRGKLVCRAVVCVCVFLLRAERGVLTSKIARLEHVHEQPLDGDVADGLAEEQLLYGRPRHYTEGGQQQEKLAEPADTHKHTMVVIAAITD